jgi:DNA polymerase
MDARRLAYLDAMGVVAWQRREFAGEQAVTATEPVTAAPAAESPLVMDWDSLQQAASTCRACELHETRANVVFGVGERNASLMFIGEAPGAEEDRQGEPFVGAAGQLLNAMLKAIGMSRGDVFIANMLKCRPPGNRDPRPGEVAACAAYLARQVQLVQPRLIVALGRVAAQHLLQSDAPLGRLRGNLHEFGPQRIPFLATYHPAYLLRKPADKRKSWEDLKRIREVLAE